jgi:ribonuclease III
MNSAQSIIKRWLDNRIEMIDPKKIKKDAKSLLQESLQGNKIALPKYEVISIEGEAHSQNFIVQCHIDSLGITVEGDGESRKVAEQTAAKKALVALGKKGDL